MGCTQQPMYRFTWPGQDEKCICLIHAMKLIDIVRAMGFHLQIIPLSPEEMMNKSCSQETEPSPLD